jgi:hypothetical protein
MPAISNKPLGYLVVCKLTRGADYSGLHKALGRFHHRMLFEGVWMIRTKEAAAWIHRCTFRRLKPGDQIVIFEITDQGVWSGDMPVETSQFIKDICLSIAPQTYVDVQEARRVREKTAKDKNAV